MNTFYQSENVYNLQSNSILISFKIWPSFDELLYNRKNWRDIKKVKGQTRSGYVEEATKDLKKIQSLNKELLGDNAKDSGINQEWKQDNQAWWDWYVNLADNKADLFKSSFIELPPLPKLDMISESDIQAELSLP